MCHKDETFNSNKIQVHAILLLYCATSPLEGHSVKNWQLCSSTRSAHSFTPTGRRGNQVHAWHAKCTVRCAGRCAGAPSYLAIVWDSNVRQVDEENLVIFVLIVIDNLDHDLFHDFTSFKS